MFDFMVNWNPTKLTESLGNHLAKRLKLKGGERRIKEGLESIDFSGIELEIKFEDEREKLLIITIVPYKKELDGLESYITKEVETGAVFLDGHDLQVIGERREFKKYVERLEYVGKKMEKRVSQKEEFYVISLIYRVKEPALKLSNKSFRNSVFRYSLAPILSWAQRKK